MSDNKTIQGNLDLQGHANVSRYVNVGGGISVQGDVTVGHDIVVKGWLDAPNIRGASKGMFSTPEGLMKTYPRPKEGWYALVGTELPAWLYLAVDGVWVNTGNKTGTMTLDVERYREEVAAMDERITAAQASANAAADDAEAARKLAVSAGSKADSNDRELGLIQMWKQTADERITAAQASADAAADDAEAARKLAVSAGSKADDNDRELGKLQMWKQTADERITETDADVDLLQTQIGGLQTKASELETNIEADKTKLSTHESEISNLQKAVLTIGNNLPSLPFDGAQGFPEFMVENGEPPLREEVTGIFYDNERMRFIVRTGVGHDSKYYSSWPGLANYHGGDGHPREHVFFFRDSDHTVWIWDGDVLKEIGGGQQGADGGCGCEEMTEEDARAIVRDVFKDFRPAEDLTEEEALAMVRGIFG